jgi:hypothetical protein
VVLLVLEVLLVLVLQEALEDQLDLAVQGLLYPLLGEGDLVLLPLLCPLEGL